MPHAQAAFNFTRATIDFCYNEAINMSIPLVPRDVLSTATNNGFFNLIAAPPWAWGGSVSGTANPNFDFINTFYQGVGVGDETHVVPLFYGWNPTFDHAATMGQAEPTNRPEQWDFFAFGDYFGNGPNGDPAFGYDTQTLLFEKNRCNPFLADVWCNNIKIKIPPLDGTANYDSFNQVVMAWGSLLAVCRKV